MHEHELRVLLDRFWIVKQQDKNLYFEVKRALPKYRKFINEHLGWNLIVNEKVIKLEKIPAHSAHFMGITEFEDVLDYCLLCVLLIYLESMDDGEQFLLSEMTTALSAFAEKDSAIDWTKFQHRKALVRVLRYVEKIGMLLVYEGNSEYFANSQTNEVLYESTGLSRYFSVHFSRNISEYRSVNDFEQTALPFTEADRGRVRINKVYRQLTVAPAYYWMTPEDSEYDYIKNQRSWVAHYMDQAIGGTLHIHKNGVFFVIDEDDKFGLHHPRDAAISDAALMLCRLLREAVLAGELLPENNDMIFMSWQEFYNRVELCKMLYEAGWSKTLREKSVKELSMEFIQYMKEWMLLTRRGSDLILYPGAGKWIGRYPEDFCGENITNE